MNHAQLRAFHAVATQGSFTKAAEALHVTQPTLSDHVRALESRFDVKLFKRRGRGVALTGLGHALLEITRRQFAMEAEAELLLASAQGIMSGTLRIAADGPFLIIPLLGDFNRRYPGIDLTVNFGNSEKVLGELFALQADVAVLPDLDPDPRLHSIPFRRDRLVCFVNRSHRWARRRSISLDEIASERLVMREVGSTTRAIFEQTLRRAGVQPAARLQVGSREGVREAVAAGLGVGVISESEFGHDDRLRAVVVRDQKLQVTEYLVCLKENRPMPVISALFELAEN